MVYSMLLDVSGATSEEKGGSAGQVMTHSTETWPLASPPYVQHLFHLLDMKFLAAAVACAAVQVVSALAAPATYFHKLAKQAQSTNLTDVQIFQYALVRHVDDICLS
jgi:type VI protein secretion system component VasF